MGKILKAAGAILATVIGAVIVFYLTSPGGLLNPPKKPVADLYIADTELLKAHVGHGAEMRFKVYNGGDADALGCAVYWESSEEFSQRYEASTLDPNTSYRFTLSERFDLGAGETYLVTSTSLPYEQSGHKYSRAAVGCSNTFNYDVQSHETIVDFDMK